MRGIYISSKIYSFEIDKYRLRTNFGNIKNISYPFLMKYDCYGFKFGFNKYDIGDFPSAVSVSLAQRSILVAWCLQSIRLLMVLQRSLDDW